MQNCIEIYITDKTGKRYFKTLCNADYVEPEARNLARKLNEAKQYPDAYSFLDLATAYIEQTAITIN